MPTQHTTAQRSVPADPKAAYDELAAQKLLEYDPAQLAVLDRLQTLHATLCDKKKPRKGSVLKRLQTLTTSEAPATPQGVYIWGSVGRGKSMLMDLFYQTLPDIRKRRVHFHRFMQDLHTDFHQFRKAAGKKPSDPVEQLVEKLTTHMDVLCFDELQATDVTDATLITRLFERLMERGVVVVATSNRPPPELYTGGVQRERFERLTQLIQSHFDILKLDSPHDYRLRQVQGLSKTYTHPLGAEADLFIQDVMQHLAPAASPQPLKLTVLGRVLELQQYGERVCKASFAELCEKPLGAPDYLALASALEVLVLTDIPQLTPDRRNEAKRFVTLIDALYEHKTKLICTAAAAPEKLYTEGDGSFEFQRTASRLIEMQSKKFIV